VLAVGVNHVRTGMATYVNIGATDPIRRLGLEVSR
jgi:hypothetical protein